MTFPPEHRPNNYVMGPCMCTACKAWESVAKEAVEAIREVKRTLVDRIRSEKLPDLPRT